jgi:hypothetical protein
VALHLCAFIVHVRNFVFRKAEITVEPRFTNLIRSWRPFVTRNVRKPKLCVLRKSYTATDSHPPILPACRQPLLPPCVFVTRDVYFFGKFVRKPKLCLLSESYTATDSHPPILPACRQPLLPACVFVTRDTVRHPRHFFSENLFVNRFVRDERRS